MIDNIITIATFYDPFKAYIVKTLLEYEGTESYIADGNVFPTHSFFSNEGGVKLRVKVSDSTKAIEIIRKAKL